eukprot:1011249-Prymnesium_polylepis.1
MEAESDARGTPLPLRLELLCREDFAAAGANPVALLHLDFGIGAARKEKRLSSLFQSLVNISLGAEADPRHLIPAEAPSRRVRRDGASA